ncbi:hypothetical protein PI125_g21754 [Phytophthora idaei]|nr:hypothetical protein PI125_g21754 [Phytophthora idaei]KAG3129977.1 hypothetical protein PI126_g20707 [Phytophthora idaei]
MQATSHPCSNWQVKKCRVDHLNVKRSSLRTLHVELLHPSQLTPQKRTRNPGIPRAKRSSDAQGHNSVTLRNPAFRGGIQAEQSGRWYQDPTLLWLASRVGEDKLPADIFSLRSLRSTCKGDSSVEAPWIEGVRQSTYQQQGSLTFMLNGEPYDKWYYHWESSSHKMQRATKHVLRAYVFYQVPGCQDMRPAEQGNLFAGDILDLLCFVDSPPFTLVSYRRSSKKDSIKLTELGHRFQSQERNDWLDDNMNSHTSGSPHCKLVGWRGFVAQVREGFLRRQCSTHHLPVQLLNAPNRWTGDWLLRLSTLAFTLHTDQGSSTRIPSHDGTSMVSITGCMPSMWTSCLVLSQLVHLKLTVVGDPLHTVNIQAESSLLSPNSSWMRLICDGRIRVVPVAPNGLTSLLPGSSYLFGGDYIAHYLQHRKLQL